MTKTELISIMAEKACVSKKDAESTLKAFQETLLEEMEKGGKVQLVGFGTFETTERKARVGRNPKTNEEIQIPASRGMRFKQGKQVKERLNK